MAQASPDETFVRNLTGCQNRLYAYVLSLVPDAEAAQEVLQEANVAIWKNAANFTPGSDFNAWACTMARFAVLAYRRDRGRDRLVFDDDVVEALAHSAEQRPDSLHSRSVALEECLQLLPGEHRELIARRYAENLTVAELAHAMGRTAGTMATLLYRIRQSLLDCVQRKLTAREVS